MKFITTTVAVVVLAILLSVAAVTLAATSAEAGAGWTGHAEIGQGGARIP